jgi:DNA end-binding protein Ku
MPRYAKSKAAEPTLRIKGIGARPLWTGTLSFGLISIPVAVHPAVREDRGRARFRLLHDADLAPLERKMVCPEHGRVVSAEHTAMGYQIEPGKYVIVEEEELRALAPKRSRTIEIGEFVPLDQIDPLMFDAAYFIVPTGPAKPYQLLVEVLGESGRAGIAEFVMHQREYLVAVRSIDGLLMLNTLHYTAQIRSPGEVKVPDGKPAAKEAAQLATVIKSHTKKFSESMVKDQYAKQVQQLAEKVAASDRKPAAKKSAGAAAKSKRGLKVLEPRAESKAGPARKAKPPSKSKSAAGKRSSKT